MLEAEGERQHRLLALSPRENALEVVEFYLLNSSCDFLWVTIPLNGNVYLVPHFRHISQINHIIKISYFGMPSLLVLKNVWTLVKKGETLEGPLRPARQG